MHQWEYIEGLQNQDYIKPFFILIHRNIILEIKAQRTMWTTHTHREREREILRTRTETLGLSWEWKNSLLWAKLWVSYTVVAEY